jgi:hypothetical protein
MQTTGRGLAATGTAVRGAVKGTAGAVPAATQAAFEKSIYGALGGPGGMVAAAKIAAAKELGQGAITGARTALADAAAAREAAAASAGDIPPAVTALSPDYFNRLQLPPGPTITPAPPDTSFVRSVPAMYPTGPSPARALPPGRPVIVPEAPPDTSFVRSMPAQYPDVVPSALRINAPAETAAMSLRDLMRESGTLPPQPPPAAAEAPAAEAPNPFEAYGRIAKAGRLAKAAAESGITAEDAHAMITDEANRNLFAKAMHEDSVSPQTMALIENELKKLEPPKRSRGRKQ